MLLKINLYFSNKVDKSDIKNKIITEEATNKEKYFSPRAGISAGGRGLLFLAATG